MSDRASKSDVITANREIMSFALSSSLAADNDGNGRLMTPLDGALSGCHLTWDHNDPGDRLFFCVVTREGVALSHGHETPDGAHVAALARVSAKPRDVAKATAATSQPSQPHAAPQAHPQPTSEWAMRCALAKAGWGALQWSATDAPEGTLRACLEGDHILTARARDSNPSLMVEVAPPWSGGSSVHCTTPAAALSVVIQWERQHSERARASAEAADILRAMLGGDA
jgi:hypothetical protein